MTNQTMMYAEQVLKCTGCDDPKSETDFYDYGHEKTCKDCIKKRRRLKYAENPEPTKARARKRTKEQPDKVKDSKLRQTYGIGLKDYKRMLAEQNGVCAICDRPETAVWRGKIMALAVDHHKSTGQVRGLLCMKCNRAQGLLEENLQYIMKLFAYVLKYLMLR